eukprot:TRINITY_DN11121_c0_g1_i1.p1 TRINITY_DN11121_c0_g1~~TRINITY_DN11121_c0_g1_i1.p1  ORF type:complete len:254 (+),score=38.81 TRINITY_DN11121_c0_g1_i1:183-944(+)
MAAENAGARAVTSELLSYSKGPLRAFYKGSAPPLMFTGAQVAVQFAVQQRMKRVLGLDKPSATSPPSFYALQFVSGATAGFAQSPIAAAAEHVKVRMQTQRTVAGQRSNGVWLTARHLWRTGGAGNLFRGFGPTACRESLGYGTFFVVAEVLLGRAVGPSGSRSDVPPAVVLAVGVLAGLSYWLAVYPLDVVKTKMQSGSGPSSAADTLKHVLRAQGLRGLYNGVGVTLLMAVPKNAAKLLGFEQARRWCSDA